MSKEHIGINVLDLKISMSTKAMKKIEGLNPPADPDEACGVNHTACTAVALGICASFFSRTETKDVNVALSAANAAKKASGEDLSAFAIMGCAIDTPWGKFQMAFMPSLNILTILDESESQAAVMDACRIAADAAHAADCKDPTCPAHGKGAKTKGTGLADFLNQVAAKAGTKKKAKKNEPTVEIPSQERIPKFDNENPN